jgi:hypothetical protein
VSVTQSSPAFAPTQHRDFATEHRDFATKHPQLTPFLVAVAMFAVSAIVAVAITGLPA